MLRAIERGLSLSDFEVMTVGMIVGYVTTYNNEHLDSEDADKKEEGVRIAGQKDFDAF